MRRFADLLDRLILTPSRTTKLRLIGDYFAHTPDPDRGWALAALAGTLDLRAARPSAIRELIGSRTDPVLFALSYDYVGDLAETAALMWPEPAATGAGRNDPGVRLSEVAETLAAAPSAAAAMRSLAGWLDGLDTTGRWALLKLATGGLRVGVSAGLAKAAFAAWAKLAPEAVEEVWHGLEPPYEALFAWATGTGPRPDPRGLPHFRSFMLATPAELADLAPLDPSDFRAEWKWDGIRAQMVAAGGEIRLYARSGDEIGRGFPDLLDAWPFGEAAVDGELVVMGPNDQPAPFAELQKRINRRTVGAGLLKSLPAHLRLYDLLAKGGVDLRPRPFTERRAALEALVAAHPSPRFDLSPLVAFSSWAELDRLRADPPAATIEGVMLKRRDTPYLAGRPKGPWFKWKRAPLTLDVVLMYAQRGHGRRSSYFSDYTFGVWRDDDTLVPVGKAYSGFTDQELVELDRWIRRNTTERFGPVRAVAPGLVLEVAFDSVQPSPRHKSGLALRFPRIARIRWDKPAAEADRLETAAGLVAGSPAASVT
ncbi:cisplatin damage response ATP-dependent DNA ligase [Tistrella mobilis]|uniref:DNA ligase (ATP) n=1 Tax=Tistrella mobilis (strain KA081020-065) TaxID=1110502 RepID=I3TMB5_TISMK|nr:cisplatin damage response ATP-dependent DNA ligase [Tistrella mobilis]AFK53903.1 ATP-dependent DNA ligase [Tistrella mobilis KA081020-065]